MARRLAAGRLHRVHRGVYAVGHSVLGIEGRWMAAVLAVGKGAVLSHHSAAALVGLRPTSRAQIDVTTTASTRSRAGIQVHRVRALPSDEVHTARAIPCTTVARTLLDLAEVVPRRELERALDQAEVARLFDLDGIDRALRDHPTRRGSAILRALLAEYAIGRDVTRSELEERFLEACERFGLARPEVNVPLRLSWGETAVVDALWRRERLVVETDGRAFHSTTAAFERDRRRDAELQLVGWRVVRFTWRQVVGDPAGLAAVLQGLLADGQGRRGGA